MKLHAPDLENDVVRLVPLAEEHREPLREAGGREAMWQNMPVMPTGTNFNAYFDMILDRSKRGEWVGFAVYRQSDDVFAGVGGFREISRTHRRLRIDYVWHPETMRGTAIPPSTMHLLLVRALKSRFRRVSFLVAEENERAVASMQRFGAQQEGTLRNYVRLANGQWANMVILSLVQDEIRAAIDMLNDRVTAMLAKENA